MKSSINSRVRLWKINHSCPRCSFHEFYEWYIYRLMHSASELSGFTCMSSLTTNEKNLEFIVSERVQVNPDNSRAMSALTFSLFKLNTLLTKIVKLWVSRSHSVMTVVQYRIYTTIMTSRRLLCHNPVSRGTNQPIIKSELVQCMKIE